MPDLTNWTPVLLDPDDDSTEPPASTSEDLRREQDEQVERKAARWNEAVAAMRAQKGSS
jgi:hypothetical protein